MVASDEKGWKSFDGKTRINHSITYRHSLLRLDRIYDALPLLSKPRTLAPAHGFEHLVPDVVVLDPMQGGLLGRDRHGSIELLEKRK